MLDSLVRVPDGEQVHLEDFDRTHLDAGRRNVRSGKDASNGSV
jgi:hypothetical protein